jgi:uncharacterized membrane protein
MAGKKKEVDKKNSHQADLHLFHIPRTLGQRAADSLTKWAGSWTFITLFMIFLIIWVLINGYFLIQYESGNPWDPYPFILLNLFLSCLAAIQAPIILMSQNRQSEKDRLKSEYDYAVNRKAEKEIREIKNLLLKHKK